MIIAINNYNMFVSFSSCYFNVTSTKKGYMDLDGPLLYHSGANLETQYWLMKNMKNNSYNKMKCLPCSGLECCSVDIASSLMALNLDDPTIKDASIQNNIFWTCRKYNMPLRYAIVVVQLFFILIAVSLAIVIFYFRQNKVHFIS